METKKAQSNTDLVSELLEEVLSEIETMKTSVGQLASQEELKNLGQVVASLKTQVTTAQATPAPADGDARVLEKLQDLNRLIRQRPEYTLSQYVRYGGYVFGLMIVLVVGLTWLALDWKGERDEFRAAYWQADWRVRYTRQANPDYYHFMEAQFKDNGVYTWIGEQEEADQKRALAREAAEQAKALSRQANELEGKEMTKGKKKQ